MIRMKAIGIVLALSTIFTDGCHLLSTRKHKIIEFTLYLLSVGYIVSLTFFLSTSVMLIIIPIVILVLYLIRRLAGKDDTK